MLPKPYKISLTIHNLHIKLRQNIQIQATIKKSSQNFLLPKTAYLQNSIAEFNTTTEFYLQPTDPVFQIYVLLLHGSNKKFVGRFRVDVREYGVGVRHGVRGALVGGPDLGAWVQVEFLCEVGDIGGSDKQGELVHYGDMASRIKQMEQSNTNLQLKNSKLNLQLLQLQQNNLQLQNNKNSMNDNYEQPQKTTPQYPNPQIPTTSTFPSTSTNPSNPSTNPSVYLNTNPNIKIMNQQDYMDEMQGKMVKLKQLMENFNAADVREKVENIFKFQ